jgi:hypothetical protein
MPTNINTSVMFILALLAAIVATLCDANHVFTQTLSYPSPLFLNQAWWVFPAFFLAFLFMAINYLVVSNLLRNYIQLQQSTSHGSYQNLATDLTYFMLAYLLSGFGNFHPTLLCIIFYGIFFIRCIFEYEKAWLLILAMLLALGGMFFEGLLAEFNLVKYRVEDIFNVPYWLGGVYMIGAFALRSAMRALVYK